MAPDLLKFTNTTSKLKGVSLGHGPGIIPVHKVLGAHFIDLWIVFTLTLVCNGLIDVSFQNYLVTGNLRAALDLTNSNLTTLMTFVCMGMGYFYFSAFLNHGQTYGLHMMKIRYPVAQHDMTSALKALGSSLGVYASWGLSSVWVAKSLEWQDQRYHELLVYRDMPTVNLVTAIEISEEMDQQEFDIAA